MLSLPPTHGRFPVGVTTFVTPAKPTRLIGKAKLKNHNGLVLGLTDHALQLEEIAFTAYYPADLTSNPSKGINWLFRPLSDSLLGLSTYMGVSRWLLWPVVYLFGTLLKIPAYLNAPLLHPEEAQDGPEKQWPLLIFSHGLGGSRTTYSQYCSRLAASGKVVLALEHRDGSGLACISRSWGTDGTNTRRSTIYLRETDVYWEHGEEPKDYPKPLRGEQLAFRHSEIHIMYEAFRKFTTKDSDVEMENIDGSALDKASWSSLTSGGNSIIKHSEDVLFSGHSFGGATALSLLSTPVDEKFSPIPISKVIILDPWLDPLPKLSTPSSVAIDESQEGLDSMGSSAQPSTTSLNDDHPSTNNSPGGNPQVLVINSEAFTHWEDHFARLNYIVSTWKFRGKRIITLIGSKHVSFSDFSILPILCKQHDMLIFDNIMRLSLAFLDDKLDETLKNVVPATNVKASTKPDEKPEDKLNGKIEHVIVRTLHSGEMQIE